MFLSKHRLNIASLRLGKHCIVKNIASLRKVNIAHPYQRVALPEKTNESSWILKQKVSQITYLTYEAGLVSISLKSSLVFDELKLSWRHDGSKNSTPNSALISARPSVKWQMFSYKEENQSKKSKFQKPTIWGKTSSSLWSESSPWTSWQTKGTNEERDGKSGMEKEGQTALSNKSLS